MCRAADDVYKNASNHTDMQNARIDHEQALARVKTAVMEDDTESYNQFMVNEGLHCWLPDTVLRLTYKAAARGLWD